MTLDSSQNAPSSPTLSSLGRTPMLVRHDIVTASGIRGYNYTFVAVALRIVYHGWKPCCSRGPTSWLHLSRGSHPYSSLFSRSCLHICAAYWALRVLSIESCPLGVQPWLARMTRPCPQRKGGGLAELSGSCGISVPSEGKDRCVGYNVPFVATLTTKSILFQRHFVRPIQIQPKKFFQKRALCVEKVRSH